MRFPHNAMTAILSTALVGCIYPPRPESSHMPNINHEAAITQDGIFEVCELENFDTYLENLVDTPYAGCAAAVADSSGVVYAAADGYAELNSCDAADTDTAFSIHSMSAVGSVSKLITAVAFMRLWEDGYIDNGATDELDVLTIGDFLDLSDSPTIPSWVSNMTLHDVLTHQAFENNDAGWSLVTEFNGNNAVTEALTTTTAPDLSDLRSHLTNELTGDAKTWLDDGKADRWDVHPVNAIHTLKGQASQAIEADRGYSNIGYTFIAAIIDSIVRDIDCDADPSCGPYGANYEHENWDMGYESYTWWVWNGMGEDVFGPTSMALNHGHREANIPELAKDYDTEFEVSCDAADTWYPGWISGPGGWVMTVSDLARLGVVVRDESILKASTWTEMKKKHSDVRGGYGYGLMVWRLDKYNDWQIGHGGLVRGYTAGVFYSENPVTNNVGAWMCNSFGSIWEDKNEDLILEEGTSKPGRVEMRKRSIGFAARVTSLTAPTCDDPDAPVDALGKYFGDMESDALDYLDQYGSRAESMFRSEMKKDSTGTAMLNAFDDGDYDTARECALVYLGDTTGKWSCSTSSSSSSKSSR